MESSSSMPGVSPAQNLRQGQQAVLDHFKQNWNTVAQLPTGYGKTLAGAACYKAAREAGKANRLLWIVPRRAQADQAAESVPHDLDVSLKVGGLLRDSGDRAKPKSWDISTHGHQALKAHRMGTCEIFVVTVQGLMSSETLGCVHQIMQTGMWMVVIDEHHHYGDIDQSRWVQAVNTLSASSRLAMSATPYRRDGCAYFPAPDVVVPYVRAARHERAVKRLHLNVYDYTVDVIVDGEVMQYTCDQLIDVLDGKADNPADIEARMAERKMRWSPKYVSPLIQQPIGRLVELRLLSGVRGQMLVQALSCSHAQVLCEQIRSLVPNGMRVDWVGTGSINGRPDEENQAVLRAFCPAKSSNGLREWTLDVLVNVGMAGEGLDTVDVCEVVFCTRPRKNPSTLQAIGRAARLMRVPTGKDQPLAHINVDKVSDLRECVGYEIMSAFDGIADDEPDDDVGIERDPSGDEHTPMPDEPYVFIANVELTDIYQDPMFIELTQRHEEKFSWPSDAEARKHLSNQMGDIYREMMENRDRVYNGKAEHAQIKEQVSMAVSHLVSLVVQIGRGGLRLERTQVGDIMKRINAQKKRAIGCSVKEATTEQLREHYHWCVATERELMNTGVLPQWLA